MPSAERLQRALHDQFGDKIDGVHTSFITSFYYADDGGVRELPEVRTLMDSAVAFVDLRKLVESIHPYDLPMIVSTAHGGPLIAKRENLERYIMGTVDINETTPADMRTIAKELVQIRYVACAHVEAAEGKEHTHRLTVKTTSASRKQITREFGGLDFDWVPLQGNRPFLEWLDRSVSSSTGEL